MPACPVCRDDFEDHVDVCPTDGEPLVARADLPPPPVEEAPLGLFHPATVLLVRRYLQSRQVPSRLVEVDDHRVEVWVPRPVRDDLRAGLTLAWTGIVRALEPEARDAVLGAAAAHGPDPSGTTRGQPDHPGWWDAPRGAWIDDDGRLRVEASPDEEAVADAQRVIGPGLVIGGLVVLLLQWVTGFDAGPVVLALGAIVLGLLLPR